MTHSPAPGAAMAASDTPASVKLPKWIDAMKGSDPTMDGVIEWIEANLATPAPSAVSSDAGEREPVEYQYRTRAVWQENWGDWTRCTQEAHADYVKVPLLHDWKYEVRALYLTAHPGAQQVRDALESLERCAIWIENITVEQLALWRDTKVAEIRTDVRALKSPAAPTEPKEPK